MKLTLPRLMLAAALGLLVVYATARADDLLLCKWNDFIVPNNYTPTPLESEICESLKDCGHVMEKDDTFNALNSCYDLVQELKTTQVALAFRKTQVRRLQAKLKARK